MAITLALTSPSFLNGLTDEAALVAGLEDMDEYTIASMFLH